MRPKAPRLPWRLWRGLARGAVWTLCFWIAVPAPSVLAETIVRAKYTDPTHRYSHGVLGDDVEYGALELTLKESSSRANRGTHHAILRSATLTIRLPLDRVFEDIAPRLADVDLDGEPEVVVVETQNRTGAQLAIYDARGKKIAATPHIGTRNRWLAPAGIGDLDGDGAVELAYIDRPHLAKRLRIWRYEHGTLTHVADAEGLTNHRIGEDFISGGLRDCGSGPEIVTANADWSRLMASRLANGQISTRDLGAFTKARLAKAMVCK